MTSKLENGMINELMINEIPADGFTHVLHLGKAGVGLASPSRGRPKPWRSWWSRTERPRKFYDFRAWVWKCLESARSGRDSLGISWNSMVKIWNMMILSWRMGFQTFSSTKAIRPRTACWIGCRHIAGTSLRRSTENSPRTRRPPFKLFPLLTLCQINLDEFPTITTSGICSSCLILIDSQKAFALWFHCQDISVVFGPPTCFGWIRCFLMRIIGTT